MNRREHNKQERRQRVLRAAFELFAEKGFEQTTTREIAKRAGVAVGTVFLYAQDKIDLCLQCFNDDLDSVTDLAFAQNDFSKPLLDQITVFFAQRFEIWARNPKLSRAVAREMTAIYPAGDSTSAERLRGIERRDHTMARLTEILRRGRDRGELRADYNPEDVSRIIYGVFLVEYRYWLGSDPPVVDVGVARFRSLTEVLLRGMLTVRAAAPQPGQTEKVS